MTELPLVLQLDVTGNPSRWIDYERSAYYYSKNLVLWSMGQINFDLHGGMSSITGKRSILTMNTIIAIKGKVNEKQFRQSNRVPLTNRTLFRRDQNVCAFCGNQFRVADLTRDHIIPQSRGGKNLWTNVVTSCAPCNKHKSDRTPEEANMPLLYVPYAPNRAEYLILSNKKILGDQMDFLLKKVSRDSRLLS